MSYFAVTTNAGKSLAVAANREVDSMRDVRMAVAAAVFYNLTVVVGDDECAWIVLQRKRLGMEVPVARFAVPFTYEIVRSVAVVAFGDPGMG